MYEYYYDFFLHNIASGIVFTGSTVKRDNKRYLMSWPALESVCRVEDCAIMRVISLQEYHLSSMGDIFPRKVAPWSQFGFRGQRSRWFKSVQFQWPNYIIIISVSLRTMHISNSVEHLRVHFGGMWSELRRFFEFRIANSTRMSHFGRFARMQSTMCLHICHSTE